MAKRSVRDVTPDKTLKRGKARVVDAPKADPMVGTVIKLNRTQRKVMEPMSEALHDAQAAFNEAGRNLRRAQRNLWDTIAQIKPGVHNKYLLTFNHETGEIMIGRELYEWEKDQNKRRLGDDKIFS